MSIRKGGNDFNCFCIGIYNFFLHRICTNYEIGKSKLILKYDEGTS